MLALQVPLTGSLQMDLIKLASALAPSRCPILAFTDPLQVLASDPQLFAETYT